MITKHYMVWFFLLNSFSVTSNAAATLSTESQLSQRLAKLVKGAGVNSDHLGLIVMASDEKRVIWSLNEARLMTPASLSKMITAGAILERLGPGQKFVTELKASVPVSQSVLSGDLYLVGGGDPAFVSESMWFLVNELRRTQVTKITGNIVVDDSRFDHVRIDESRDNERVDRAYDAPVGAMSFNWNAVNVFVRPGVKVGEPARVMVDPESSFMKLENRASTSERGKKITVQRVGPRLLRVSGSIGRDQTEIVAYKNILEPDLWSGENLIAFLQQRGIEVRGVAKSGRAPSGAVVLAQVESKPVSLLVSDMMKFSNNFIAEMLTKNTAAQNGQLPADLEKGVEVIRGAIEKWGVPRSRFQFINPSGLSHDNKFSAKDLALILNYLKEQFAIFPEFLSSMPIAGVDGTLKSRMKSAAGEGSIRAKTGLLAGVSGLAGYVGRKGSGTLTFVFMFNGPSGHTERAKLLFDQLALELVQ